MKLGIAGLPNVGKSTLFNALTHAGAQAANYPFCTIDPNVGIVPVPDERLAALEKMYDPAKVTPATIEFVDIAGLVRGASKGEGLGNRFLAHIREVDAVVQVLRCFEDDNVTHVDGGVDPLRDKETVELEFVLADLEMMERRIDRLRKSAKGGDKQVMTELELCERIAAHLGEGKSARGCEMSEDERALAQTFTLLTMKPMIYACNVAEEDLADGGESNALVAAVREMAKAEGAQALVVSAKVEEELAALDEEERADFLEALGLKEAGLERLVSASYDLLGLISYLTAGPKEVRAWTIEKGTRAPQAAGKIHSDFERGFIRAEVVAYDDLMACGSYNAAREKGLVRSEGKEYVMKDGDVVLFRFNV
ncbi:MAG: redox-regulated ATPase YchF [Clostridia bacterium]|nr:redox-regulated ATPase YchF [Clostridia bacterium]